MPAYKMGSIRGDHGQHIAQPPVSPLSPRSEAILAQRSSAMQVSPLQSPTALCSIPQGAKKPTGNYTLPPKAYVMPIRKPVGSRPPPNEGKVSEHAAIVPSRSARDTNQSRPRSHSFRPPSELVAMPTGFLQDFSNHTPADPVQQHGQNVPQDVPTGFLQDFTNHAFADAVWQDAQTAPQDTPGRRPRSQTLPSPAVEVGLDAYRRRGCAACGKLQKKSQQDFICCKKCTNVWYCTVECWDKRVCHSRPAGPERRCAICGLRQSSADHVFQDCGKCKDVGKAIYFCSDRCWDQRKCHIRATTVQQHPVAPPIQPTRTYHPGARSQQHRQEHLPKQTPQTYGQRRTDARAPESSRHDQEYRPVDVAPEKQESWLDSKTFAVSVLIAIPVIIFIVILSLVLGLKG